MLPRLLFATASARISSGGKYRAHMISRQQENIRLIQDVEENADPVRSPVGDIPEDVQGVAAGKSYSVQHDTEKIVSPVEIGHDIGAQGILLPSGMPS